jgi:hypothetical protein
MVRKIHIANDEDHPIQQGERKVAIESEISRRISRNSAVVYPTTFDLSTFFEALVESNQHAKAIFIRR